MKILPSFYRDTEAEINKLPIKNGAIYLSTDKKNLFFDINDTTRIKFSGDGIGLDLSNIYTKEEIDAIIYDIIDNYVFKVASYKVTLKANKWYEGTLNQGTTAEDWPGDYSFELDGMPEQDWVTCQNTDKYVVVQAFLSCNNIIQWDTSSDGPLKYSESYIRQYLNTTLYNSLPESIRIKIIKTTNIYQGYDADSNSLIQDTSENYIWLPSVTHSGGIIPEQQEKVIVDGEELDMNNMMFYYDESALTGYPNKERYYWLGSTSSTAPYMDKFYQDSNGNLFRNTGLHSSSYNINFDCLPCFVLPLETVYEILGFEYKETIDDRGYFIQNYINEALVCGKDGITHPLVTYTDVNREEYHYIYDAEATPKSGIKFRAIQKPENDIDIIVTDFGQTIEQYEKELEEIYVQTQPNKTEYKSGESFDPTGMTIIAKYKILDREDIDMEVYEVIQ